RRRERCRRILLAGPGGGGTASERASAGSGKADPEAADERLHCGDGGGGAAKAFRGRPGGGFGPSGEGERGDSPRNRKPRLRARGGKQRTYRLSATVMSGKFQKGGAQAMKRARKDVKKGKGSWCGCTAGAMGGIAGILATFALLPGTVLVFPVAATMAAASFF